jgi:hypothetical protein
MSREDPIILSKKDLIVSKDKIIELCIKILNFISLSYFDGFVPLTKAKLLSSKYDKSEKAFPEDKNLNILIKQLIAKEINCSIADIPLSKILPFSYDYCFKVPLILIDEAEKIIKENPENKILLYWNEDRFVMSDDYTVYLAFRKLNYEIIRAVIIGDVPPDVKIIKIGGQELLPPLISFRKGDYDNLPLPIKDLHLSRYLNRLNTIKRVQDISDCDCVVFSEDSNLEMLEAILVSSGFDIDQTIIYSYKNCTNLDALEFNVASLRKINPGLKIVIHRDRDYMTDDEIKKIENTILKLNAFSFITKGTDIESYFLNIKHIHSIYKNIPIERLKEINKKVFEKLKNDSIQKIKKHEY